MKSLENKQQYLINRGLTESFLDEKILKDKVFCDYNSKIKDNPNYTILHSLFFWINKKENNMKINQINLPQIGNKSDIKGNKKQESFSIV